MGSSQYNVAWPLLPPRPDVLQDDAGRNAVLALHFRGHVGLPCPIVVGGAPSLHAFVSFWPAARMCSSTNTRTVDDKLPATRFAAT